MSLMNKSRLASICTWVSFVSILIGFASIFAALQPAMTKNWAQVISGCVPQAILIAGGLIALSICASTGVRDDDKK